MRTEGFKRGVVSILLVFALMFSMISVTPLASPGDLIYDPSGENIEVAQGSTFLIRHTLEFNQPENGAYSITIAWLNYDNDPSENLTFVSATAYYTTGPYAGEYQQADVTLSPSPAGEDTRWTLLVMRPSDNKDNRDGQFNVDITLGAYGVGGVPHIPGDHVIPWQFGGIIIVEKYPQSWNRDPITIRVGGRGVRVSIEPESQFGLIGENVVFTVTVKNIGDLDDTYDLTVSDNAGWGATLAQNLLTIPAGENRTTTVSVTVPSNAIGNESTEITVVATSQEDPTVSDSATCIATAAALRAVEVSISPSEDSGVPEEMLTYEVTVTNTGNVEDTYVLEASDNAGWDLAVSPFSLTIPPNSYGTATLTVIIPDEASSGDEDEITVTATSTENAEISGNATCIASAVFVRGVEVSISPPENSGTPGEDVSFTVTIINTGDVADSYTLEASDNADPSWDPTVSPTWLGIAAGSSGTATVSVIIHEGTASGIEDEITVTAISNTDPTVSDSATCIATAATMRGVEVSISPPENSGGPGENVNFTVTVINTGNVTDNYALTVSDNAGWAPSLLDNLLENVGLSENKTATLTVKIPEDASPGEEDEITVMATSITDPTGSDSTSCIAHAGVPADYIYLTWATPDTAHTINVSWRTDENYAGEVHYDIESRNGAPEAYSSTTEGTGGVTTSKFEGYIHHVELTELEPDTIYYFICGNPDHGWSEELSFRTAPVEGKDIRFVVGGDSRSDARLDYPHPDWPEARDGVSQLMASYDPDFVIFSGDFLWSGELQTGSDTWDNWLWAMYKYWRTDSNRLIPIIPAIGNHELVYPQPSDYDPETHASNYYMLFNLPRNERWYSLNWGPDLHIVALDSEIRWTGSESWNDQLEWLRQDLLEHWDDRWKIAAAHRPAFSSGHYSGDANVQKDWIPEFDFYHVDLYFSGHDHNYQRTHPINFSISTENYQPSPENGTIYMVSAGWGAPLYGGSPRWWTAYGPDPRYHFTLVDAFENGTLHFQAINLDGTVFDEFSIYRDLDVSILPGEVIVRGKDTAYNTDLEGPSPLKEYASSPPLMVATKVGSGAVVATGTVSTCRDTRWNGEGNPTPNFDVLLDKAFQWMVPGATKVLWFEGYGVYNTIDAPEVQCQQLEDALEAKGYTLTGDTTTPITSGLLSGYDILVIPQMALGDRYVGGNPAFLPDSDVQAIVNFVSGGGCLLIMESSDYGGHNYSAVHNKILTALNVGFYFQHDQVQDDTNNWGGANYQPIADVDTTTEIGSAYQSATGTNEIGLYSICSLRIEKDYEVSVTVSPTINVGRAGEVLTYDAIIMNIGTKSDTYTLTVEDELGWSISLSKNAASLEPGESTVVEVRVTVPEGLTEKMVNWITLTASGVSEDVARFRAINIFLREKPPYPIVRPDVTRFLGPGLPTLLVDPPAVPVITAIETGFSIDLTPREPEPILYGKGEFAPVVVVELIGNGRVMAFPNSILRDAYFDRPELANDEVMSMIVRWMIDWEDPRGHSLLYWVTEDAYHLPPGTGAPIVTKYVEMLEEDFGFDVGTQVGGEITPEIIGGYDVIQLAEILRPLSAGEIQAVVDYVNDGGGLIIMCSADYGGFGRPRYPNEVLEALGSGIRFQDDELYDEDSWVVDGPWFPQVYFLDPREANSEFDVWFPEHNFAIYMPVKSMTLESARALFTTTLTNVGTAGSTYTIEVTETTTPENLGWDIKVKQTEIEVAAGENVEIYTVVTVPDIEAGRKRMDLRIKVTDAVQDYLTRSDRFAVLGEDGRMPPEAKFEVGQRVSHVDWGEVTIVDVAWGGSAWAYVVETAEGELKLAAEEELAEIPPVIEWDASITVTFSGGGDDAIFGVRPDATDNFDSVYDIPEPPAPPEPPHVRAYFYYPGQTPDELHCSYLAPENLMGWPLRIEYADNIEDITLMWSVKNISSKYPVLLYRGGDLVADMRAEENYTFEASTGSYDFRIVVGRIVPFTLELTQGWNMISFPVLPENSSPDAVFGSYYVLYRWDAEDKRYVLHADSGSFVEPDPDVEAGVGYWAYVLEDENVNLLGVPVDQLTLSLRQDWSLIGPPYGGSGIADPADNPSNSVLPYAFTWNAREKSYSMTQLLEAGKGYWAYALQDCTLTLLPRRLEPAAIKIGFPISTVIEEPWIGAIYTALVRAENELGITFDWSDDIGYADLPAVIREWATEYDIVITDSFGCEEAARIAARDFPDTQFVFGSGLGPVEPNVAVFDDWIHEPAYISGMIAGKLTETNIIGVVGGVPVPEVNRLINAFKAGALETNPDVKMKVVFLGEWFNPPIAKEKALAQIEAGADVMYAERYGVHEAALEKLATEDKAIPLFGNLLDQYELAPALVVTGPVWDMWPTVNHVIETYILRDGEPFSMDLAEWSMAAKGGAKLAGWPELHDWETRLDSRIVAKMQAEDIISMVETRWAEIIDGTFRVDIDESVPVSD